MSSLLSGSPLAGVSPLPASVSALRSLGVPAVQSRGVVVALAQLVPLGRGPALGWRLQLVSGTAGQELGRIAWCIVVGRSRAQAFTAGRALALRYAQALATLHASATPSGAQQPALF